MTYTYEQAKPYLKVGMTVIPKKMRSFSQLDGTECKIYFINNDGYTHIRNENGDTGCFCLSQPNEELEILTNPDGTPWVHPDKVYTPEFKVGDRVRGINADIIGCEGLIVGLTNDGRYEIKLTKLGTKEWHGINQWTLGNVIDKSDWKGSLEKIEDAPKFYLLEEECIFYHWESQNDYPHAGECIKKQTNEPQAQKKGIIMNVVDKLKNLALSKEDRILRAEGLEDENGKMTDLADDLMWDEIEKERWNTRRLEIAKDLLKIKTEDCKK